MGYVAYYELNIDYIIETYCVNKEKPELQCNGKCHLATQLVTNIQDTTNEAPYLSTLFETFIPVYFEKYVFNLIFQNNSIQNNWNYSQGSTSKYQGKLDKPPQV